MTLSYDSDAKIFFQFLILYFVGFNIRIATKYFKYFVRL